MGEYHYIDHTAELGVAASGETLQEVLSLIAEGMFAVIADLENVEAQRSVEIEVTAPSPQALVVEWLNDLLYHSEVENLLLRNFDILEASETHVRARCSGEPIDPQKHLLRSGVKAATYHMAHLEHNDKYEAQVILDI